MVASIVSMIASIVSMVACFNTPELPLLSSVAGLFARD